VDLNFLLFSILKKRREHKFNLKGEKGVEKEKRVIFSSPTFFLPFVEGKKKKGGRRRKTSKKRRTKERLLVFYS